MITCKKCQFKFEGNYCPECGTPVDLERIDRRYILKQVVDVLAIKKGLFFTIKELTVRPGESVRSYIKEDRTRLVKPIIFLFICSLAYSLEQQIFHVEDQYLKEAMGESANADTLTLMSRAQEFYGYINIVMSFLIAFWTYILFGKSGYNYYEILILIFYITGLGMLISTLFGIGEIISGLSLFQISLLLGPVYSIWAMGNFFQGRRVKAYLKASFSYLMAILSIFLLEGLVLVIVHLIGKGV